MGRVRLSADRRRGSELGFCVKMGSSEVKKSLQVGRNYEIIARKGGFFFGLRCAKPKKPPSLAAIFVTYPTWSHDRDLNPRPLPYHGSALPTELSRHILLRVTLRYAPGYASWSRLRSTNTCVSRRSYRGIANRDDYITAG